ncbi:MAG TPA: hypothetical protein VER11_31550 [Polyangiaceae bacterium]|nr:hypothetical protein [Polyangiaceae bacterium]
MTAKVSNPRAVFLEAMTEVVLPGLRHCGVATSEARHWLEAFGRRWQI